MSKIRLAREIAEVTGRSLTKALRYISDVGSKTARKSVEAAKGGASWKLPATLTAGGGGALAWRQQDVRRAEAIAQKAQAEADKQANATDALGELLDADDLSAKQIQQLAEEFNVDEEPPSDDGDDPDDDPSDDSPSGLPKLLDEILGGGDGSGGLGALVGGAQQTVILLVVVVLVLNYALNRSASAGATVNTGGSPV